MWENVSSIHPFICAYTLHSSLPALCLSLWKKNQSFNLELHVRRYHTHYYRLFSQKLSCVGDLDCFTGQFTSPDCSMTYSIRPHIWRSDGKQIVIFALQTFLGGKSFVWNQDVFQWKEPRKRNLIFLALFSLAGYVRLLPVVALPWGLLMVGHAWNTSPGGAQEASESDAWTTLTDSSQSGGAAALLRSSFKWLNSSFYHQGTGQPPYGENHLYPPLVSAMSFFRPELVTTGEGSDLDQPVNQELCF